MGRRGIEPNMGLSRFLKITFNVFCIHRTEAHLKRQSAPRPCVENGKIINYYIDIKRKTVPEKRLTRKV